MPKLTCAIKQLEQEITLNKQAIYLQFEYTKTQLTNKLTSPPVFLIAFVTGSLLGKQIKRTFKQRPAANASSRVKLSFLQKIITLSSEISVAIKMFNRFKSMAANLTKKSNSTMTVSH